MKTIKINLNELTNAIEKAVTNMTDYPVKGFNTDILVNLETGQLDVSSPRARASYMKPLTVIFTVPRLLYKKNPEYADLNSVYDFISAMKRGFVEAIADNFDDVMPSVKGYKFILE